MVSSISEDDGFDVSRTSRVAEVAITETTLFASQLSELLKRKRVCIATCRYASFTSILLVGRAPDHPRHGHSHAMKKPERVLRGRG